MSLIKQKAAEVEGTPVAPLGSGGPDLRDLPNLPASRRFTLAHHPDHWRVRGSHVLPAWTICHHDPGLNGVTEKGNPQELHAGLRQRGYVVVPESYDYMRAHRVPSGIAHLPRWVRPLRGRRDVRQDYDDEAAFAQSLYAANVIQPPDDYQLAELAQQIQRAIDASEGTAEASPQVRGHHSRRAAALRAQLAVVQAALVSLQGPPDEPAAEPAAKVRK